MLKIEEVTACKPKRRSQSFTSDALHEGRTCNVIICFGFYFSYPTVGLDNVSAVRPCANCLEIRVKPTTRAFPEIKKPR